MVEIQYEKVEIFKHNFWDDYDPVVKEGEDLGAGMCSSVTKARLKSDGPDGKEIFLKRIHNKDLMWTAENEMAGLELAGNIPGVVKCFRIYDRRDAEEEKD